MRTQPLVSTKGLTKKLPVFAVFEEFFSSGFGVMKILELDPNYSTGILNRSATLAGTNQYLKTFV